MMFRFPYCVTGMNVVSVIIIMSAVKKHDGSSVDDTNCIETTSSLWFTSTK
jgi:hypothetical protein